NFLTTVTNLEQQVERAQPYLERMREEQPDGEQIEQASAMDLLEIEDRRGTASSTDDTLEHRADGVTAHRCAPQGDRGWRDVDARLRDQAPRWAGRRGAPATRARRGRGGDRHRLRR